MSFMQQAKNNLDIQLYFSHRTNLIPSAVLAPEIPEIYLLEIGFGE